jgi:hypothetical protein
MKHIKPINEFFDFFKKKMDPEDELALEFIKRLEKIKGISPYEMKKLDNSEIFGYTLGDKITDSQKDYVMNNGEIYKVFFDDVNLVVLCLHSPQSDLTSSGIYGLRIGDERIQCRESYKKKIMELIKMIMRNTDKFSRVKRVRDNINPAADLL